MTGDPMVDAPFIEWGPLGLAATIATGDGDVVTVWATGDGSYVVADYDYDADGWRNRDVAYPTMVLAIAMI